MENCDSGDAKNLRVPGKNQSKCPCAYTLCAGSAVAGEVKRNRRRVAKGEAESVYNYTQHAPSDNDSEGRKKKKERNSALPCCCGSC